MAELVPEPAERPFNVIGVEEEEQPFEEDIEEFLTAEQSKDLLEQP